MGQGTPCVEEGEGGRERKGEVKEERGRRQLVIKLLVIKLLIIRQLKPSYKYTRTESSHRSVPSPSRGLSPPPSRPLSTLLYDVEVLISWSTKVPCSESTREVPVSDISDGTE